MIVAVVLLVVGFARAVGKGKFGIALEAVPPPSPPLPLASELASSNPVSPAVQVEKEAAVLKVLPSRAA